MENSENKTTDIEKKESENWFNKLMFKIMKFFGFTSGVGIVAVGAYWFLFSIIQYISLSPANVMQQVIHENHFNQAQTGIVIVALGILIRAVKEQK